MVAVFSCGCTSFNSHSIISEKLQFANSLTVNVSVDLSTPAAALVQYWQKDRSEKMYTSLTSATATHHQLSMTNLTPESEFAYRILTVRCGDTVKSEPRVFRTQPLPDMLSDMFKIDIPNNHDIPEFFDSKNLLLLYKREAPGYIALVSPLKGEIKWYHQFNTGVKVAHFTSDKTILAILADRQYKTSYGNELMEIGLTGDTLFHIKLGEKEFKHIAHHEILKNDKGQYTFLSVRDSVMNLASVGGKMADTIAGDGILTLDNHGRQVWKWSVFDALTPPLNTPNTAAHAKDWMHANSLCTDKEGNYYISFFNDAQIWKLSSNGQVIWKLGKDGDVKMPDNIRFDHAHAVHINPNGYITFFNNGTSQQKSQAITLKVSDRAKTATLVNSTTLPKGFYTDRMGSAYSFDDNYTLFCLSKQGKLVLTNADEKIVWTLHSPSYHYRAEVVPMKEVYPYLQN